MKQVIINADDFGWDEETTDLTIELLEKGLLTSATIMTDRPSSEKAIDYAKQHGKSFSFGLHFNLVDHHIPCSDTPSSLIDESGKLKMSNHQRKDALLWKLNAKEIQKEFECQLTQLLDAGVEVSHIDSHGHLHKFPQIVMAIKPVMKKYGIRTIRIPQNVFPSDSKKKIVINNLFRLFFFGMVTTDHFYMLENHEDENWIDNFFSKLPEGLTELGVHPGRTDHWRDIETQPFLDGSMANALRHNGIELVNFHTIGRVS